LDLVIITDKDIQERFKVGKSWIDKNSRKMGCFSRNPRKFILSRVEQYIQNLAAQNAAKDSPEMKKLLRKKAVDQIFQE
jgi:hypothetical protein